MFVFKHPKYYKELRDAGNELAKRNAVKEDLACSGSSPARNKSDQVISSGSKGSALPQRAPDPGLKQQASTKLVNACIDQREPQAPSTKPQASGFKHK
jgi:hypothetical protein